MATEDIVDLGIALVPEGRRLFPRQTVEENLLLGASRRRARAQIKTNRDFCFEVFPRLAERKNQLGRFDERAASSKCWRLPARSCFRRVFF